MPNFFQRFAIGAFSVAAMLTLSNRGIAQSQIGSDIVGMPQDFCGSGVAMNGDGSMIAVGSYGNADQGALGGAVRVYEVVGGQWVQLGQTLYGGVTQYQFGWSVALSNVGYTLAVGSWTANGFVRVFDWDGTLWIQRGGDITDNADAFGSVIDLDGEGDIVIIGTSGDYAKAFEWDAVGQQWVQKGSTFPGDPFDCGGTDGSGRAVAISADGQSAIVGSNDYDAGGDCFDNSGKAIVYAWDGTSWLQKGTTIWGNYGERFGSSVDISFHGDTVAIGGPDASGGYGVARVCRFDTLLNDWVQIGTDIHGDTYDRLGHEVSLSAGGEFVGIGCEENSSMEPGRIKCYALNNGTWMSAGTDILGATPSNSGAGRLRTVRLSDCGHRIITGHPGTGNAGQGLVRVYSYCSDTTIMIDHLACDPILVGDTLIIESTMILETLSRADCCDSTVIHNITITPLDTTVLLDGGIMTAVQDSASYQWIDCGTGQPVPGENGQSFTPMDDGNYAVQVDNGVCQGTSECATFLGTSDHGLAPGGLMLVPNPSSGTTQLVLPMAMNNAALQVHSSNGALVHQEMISGQRVSLDLSLPNGSYMITVRSDSVLHRVRWMVVR